MTFEYAVLGFGFAAFITAYIANSIDSQEHAPIKALILGLSFIDICGLLGMIAVYQMCPSGGCSDLFQPYNISLAALYGTAIILAVSFFWFLGYFLYKNHLKQYVRRV